MHRRARRARSHGAPARRPVPTSGPSWSLQGGRRTLLAYLAHDHADLTARDRRRSTLRTEGARLVAAARGRSDLAPVLDALDGSLDAAAKAVEREDDARAREIVEAATRAPGRRAARGRPAPLLRLHRGPVRTLRRLGSGPPRATWPRPGAAATRRPARPSGPTRSSGDRRTG
ncbi:Hypothetical protein MexAM1_META1p2560 [Methylorubrum extorquens AM1]|uniref:Uncharacterized protein n=1 Tax=Methylorubrum extorquens (strain ATCC 14718 / DSM 1338 / JCM 2805 / NCIMB 9133 / AM1) TaxID=272630 RepID=C5AS95_METEA|nr:Hypothetical protein MexAM1_META1p2560 [Methylorubrum extorquens AM1]